MLETIELPGSGRRTTRLGFGCSGLMGGLSERESLRLLETAYDCGIRHFDVAPSYGHGLAERCVGKFLRGKNDRVTVTTKFGISPPPSPALIDTARIVLRPLAQKLPAVRRRIATAAAGLKSKAHFCAEEARRFLETSRRELGTEHIDIWLLHEVAADDLNGSDLLPFLQAMRQQGAIRAFGVGAERTRAEGVWQKHRDYCQVVQSEWSTLDAAPSFSGAFRIFHRAISGGVGALRGEFERDSELCRRWSDVLAADFHNSNTLSAVLLQAALISNPAGLILFSSRSPEHIRRNAQAAADPAWGARGRRFLELISERQSFTSPNVTDIHNNRVP
jgi:D-threo-aldose 1-dehydrogenase